LPVFEGPLDLLLQLIERNELEISAVSLVAVTDQYLRTVEQLDEVDPGALADFLVIASRLLYIKSRSLLPLPRVADDEEEEDAGDALVRQLIEYRLFKQAAAGLRSREESGLRAYVRTAPAPELERRLEQGEASVDDLTQALRRVLARMPKETVLPRVKTYDITVAEQIDYVRTFIQRATASDPSGLRFTALLTLQATRLEVIVTFLAVLELIKQQEVAAVQDATFGEIMLMPLVPVAGAPSSSV
jgi:segregation and condensation protein A